MTVIKRLLGLVVAAFGMHAGGQTLTLPEPSRPIDGSYIVTFKPGTAKLPSPVLPSLTKDELRATAPVPFGEHSSGQNKQGLALALGIRGQVVSIFDAINAAHLMIDAVEAERLKRDPRVLRVEQNVTTTAMQTVQSNPGWALDRLDQPLPPLNNQYVFNASGAGQTIYILDTGLTLANTAVNNEFGLRASVFWDVNQLGGTDCHGHGTQVASAAAGATYGLAKGANLIIAKVTVGCTRTSTAATAITAFNWLATNAPRGTIVNYSSGLANPGNACSPANINLAMEDAIRAAFNAGNIIVVYAGNDGCDTANFTPARMPEVFAVGATDVSRLLFNQDARASFSRTGANVSVFAPGQSVNTMFFTGALLVDSGTSFSAPYMAGMFAVGCQVVVPQCATAPSGDMYALLRSIATLGSVVDPGGAALPAGTTSRFISRSPW